MSALNISHIEVLVLAHIPLAGLSAITPLAKWSSLLRALPNLKCLRTVGLDSGSAMFLIMALRRAGAEMYCPKLEVLEWVDVDFGDRRLWLGLLNVAIARCAGEQSRDAFKTIEFLGCKGSAGLGERQWRHRFTTRGVEIEIDAE